MMQAETEVGAKDPSTPWGSPHALRGGGRQLLLSLELIDYYDALFPTPMAEPLILPLFTCSPHTGRTPTPTPVVQPS